MPTAAVYCRISKDRNDDHLGVDRQELACRALADRHGLDVVEVLVDNDVSAYQRRQRPEFERLVDMLTAGQVDAVVAYHADRLYRRNTDLERLVDIIETTGARVHTVAAGDIDLSSATGQMQARIIGSVAQHDSARTGERIRMKTDELAAAGRPPGGRPPYGYGAGYVVNPAEAEVVHYIAGRVLDGASCRAIARELDDRGIATREGRPWHSSTIRAVVVNPAVTGLRVHRREIAGPGAWPAILDRETWELVKATVADPARKRTREARRYILAGLVRTPTGDPMNGRPQPSGPTYATRYEATTKMSIDAAKLEGFVTEAVLLALADWKPAAVPAIDGGPSALVAELEAEMNALAQLRGERKISMAEWLAARTPLEEALTDARKSVQPARRQRSRLLTEGGDIRAAWATATVEERRQVVAAVVEEIVVSRATKGRWTPLEERVDIRWKA